MKVLLEHGYTASVLLSTATQSHLHLAFLLCSINLFIRTSPDHLIFLFYAGLKILSLVLLRGRVRELHLLVVLHEVSDGTCLLVQHMRVSPREDFPQDKQVICCLHKLMLIDGLGAFITPLPTISLAASNNSTWGLGEYHRSSIKKKLVLNCLCKSRWLHRVYWEIPF